MIYRKAIYGLSVASAMLISPGLSAQTLDDALAKAYRSNPTLAAERRASQAGDELIAQALSGWKPSITASGDYGYEEIDADGNEQELNSRGIALDVVQPIFRGGKTFAEKDQAESIIKARQAFLKSVEQVVLLEAATAYFDVIRDQAVVNLTINNEKVLREQLQAARDRFEVGEVTRTDVSQAESRLARSVSERIQAEGNLTASRAEFERVVGSVPEKLSLPKKMALSLPVSQEEAVELALENNPSIMVAEYNADAANDAVGVSYGDWLPQLNLVGNVSRRWEASQFNDRFDSASITARLSFPLYQGGAAASRIRESKYAASESRIRIDETRRQVAEDAVSAYKDLETARATIKSRESQLKASKIALDGVHQEATVGSRTTLDILDAEQEVLDAEVNLASARRDEYVAKFTLMAAIGQLTARRLDLMVEEYDPHAHYESVRDKWFGFGIEE